MKRGSWSIGLLLFWGCTLSAAGLELPGEDDEDAGVRAADADELPELEQAPGPDPGARVDDETSAPEPPTVVQPCTPGARECHGDTPVTCGGDGLWSEAPACAHVCREGRCTGECRPGTLVCRGTIPAVCDDEGHWQTRPACSAACNQGSCAGACRPGERRCDGMVVVVCDERGAWQDDEICEASCLVGTCVGECVPGSQRCRGKGTRQLCDAAGHWGKRQCDPGCGGDCDEDEDEEENRWDQDAAALLPVRWMR